MRLIVTITVVLAFTSLVLMVAALRSFGSYSDQLKVIAITNCHNIEELKAGQREGAQATIDGDNAFLKAHPNGTPDFPRAVVETDIAAKQRTIDRFAARDCGDSEESDAPKGPEGPTGK